VFLYPHLKKMCGISLRCRRFNDARQELTRHRIRLVGVVCALLFASSAIAGENTIEGGAIYYDLSDGYQSTKGEYLRARIESSSSDAWLLDITNLDRFGDDGTQISVGNRHIFTDRVYSQFFVAGSAGGFFWPRFRTDGSISMKWLANKSFVTTIGGGYFDAKDVHEDLWGYVEASYYFDRPVVIQGGMQVNVSDPGSVSSTSGYVAASYVKNKSRIASVRLGVGNQAYQAVAVNNFQVDFPFHSIRMTWREWVGKTWGINLAAEHYVSDVYDQNGIELGFFKEF
jgi:YaiO family outer membrane protein